MTVSYTPGLELLCRDRLKGGTRDVEHRNGTYILRRPEEVENKKDEEVKQWAPPDDTIQTFTRNIPIVPCGNPEYRYINISAPST